MINDDTIAAGQGFGMHPHRDMEIITVMVEGALTHADSMGNSAVLHAGEVQRMSAGSGIVHSEINQPARPAGCCRSGLSQHSWASSPPTSRNPSPSARAGRP